MTKAIKDSDTINEWDASFESALTSRPFGRTIGEINTLRNGAFPTRAFFYLEPHIFISPDRSFDSPARLHLRHNPERSEVLPAEGPVQWDSGRNRVPEASTSCSQPHKNLPENSFYRKQLEQHALRRRKRTVNISVGSHIFFVQFLADECKNKILIWFLSLPRAPSWAKEKSTRSAQGS